MLRLDSKVRLKPRLEQKNHIFKGVGKELRDFIHSFSDVLVYFDPDVDGCIAGALVCRYLAKHNIKYSWYINSNRSHDWSLPIESVSGKDIIAVDFIITIDKVIELCDAGCNLVSMDHHINRSEFINYTSDYDTKGIVINNQYPFEDNDGRYLSGAGVVFETLIQLDPEFDTIENRALVGITLLSDVRDIENPYAEGYLYLLYNHKYKGYIKYLIDGTMGTKDYDFGVPRMDRQYVDYKFSPAVNAMLRFNREDEVVKFFLGKGNLDLDCRDNQKKLVRDLVSVIKLKKFSNLNICYFMEEDFIEYADILSSFVGLTASKYLDGERSAICYMIAKNSEGKKYVKRASFRGNINGLDYRTELLKENQFLCLGHSSAFGIKGIKPAKQLFERCNEICANVEKDSGWHKQIIEVVNMSLFVNKNASVIAEENMYKLTQNKIYIKYVGMNIENKRSGANFIEYAVNGIPVLCFNKETTFETGLIVPILDRGFVTFVLE